MKFLKFFIGLALGILLMTIPFSQFQPSSLDSLQTLAVQLDGRKKPLDAVARETVTQIHGKTNYQQENGETINYLQTYLSMWVNDRDWNKEAFILFSYRPLKERVGLDPEKKYFTFDELVNSSIGNVVLEARQKQGASLELTRDEREALTLDGRVNLMLASVGNDNLPIVPHPNDRKGTWLSILEAKTYYQPEQLTPILAEYEQIKQIYRTNRADLSKLGEIAQNLQTQLRQLSPQVYPDNSVLQREVSFYNFHPLGKAWKLYAIALVLMLLVLWIKSFDFYWTALGIFIAGTLVHSYGFIERMQIAGRPPVTNMYESVIWVAFGVAAFAVLFELIYQAKYYLLAAAPLAVVCLLLADSLPAVLDPSIKPLVPVLRDNFWLSIHVPTITLSYASFALAMGLGHITLGHYLFAPQSSQRIAKLSQLNYRVLQIGVLLLTTGVILGGIWAHFSWGRFWGWDPKETWALIALLSYLVPLHGRLVGWLSDFGMGVAAVVCFNAVLMAWYGVNFVLGTGLHSYGFGTGGSEAIVATLVGADLLFVLAATIRHKGWFVSQSSAVVEKSEESVSEVPMQQS
jgi:cytochrome c-type biogenesis protein CcsB